MNIEMEKIKLAQFLFDTNDVSILKQIKAIFREKELEYWNTVPTEIKQSIEMGLKQAQEQGRIPHTEAMK